MPITIRCPSCNKEYKVDDKLAGKKVKCRDCGTAILVASGAGNEEVFAVEETPAPKAAAKRCPSCRSPMAVGATFCAACGWSGAPAGGSGGGRDAALPLMEAAVEKKKRKWVRDAGSPMLNSIDSLINLIVWWSLLAGLAVWVYHIAKLTGSVGFQYLLPMIVVLIAMAGIVAPLIMISIRQTVKFLQLVPRDDTYNRALLALLLPLAASLLAGWPGIDKSLNTTIVTLAWLAAPALFIYFFRAEPLEWGASIGVGLVGLFVGWLIVSGVAGPLGNSMTLYQKMLPEGPWSVLATADMPAASAKPANATPTAAIASTAPTTGPAFTIEVPGNTSPGAGVGETTSPTASANATPTQPSETVPASPQETETVFLTNVVNDKPEFAGVSAIRGGPGNWALVAKANSEGLVTVERWSLQPLERKGTATLVESPMRPATYALSPKGDILVAATHLPLEEVQLFTFDGKPPQKWPLKQPCSVLGFMDQDRVCLRGLGMFQLWNAKTQKASGAIPAPGLRMEASAVTMSPNGRFIAAVVSEGSGEQIMIYDRQSELAGMLFRRIQATNTPISKLIGIAFSPDNQQVALCAVMEDVVTLLPFKVATGAPLYSRILSTHPPMPSPLDEKANTPGLMWLQNGLAWVVSGNDLYDTASGKKMGSLHATNVVDEQLVGADSLLMLQETSDGSKRAVLAKFDDEKMQAAVDKLKAE